MTITVTGATGFIGRHLVRVLENERLPFTIVVRDASRCEALDPAIRRVEFDLQETPTDAYGLLGSPRTLIHLAWGGLPNYGSLHHFETEMPAHYRFIKAMVLAGVKRVLVAGTCLEYGLCEGELEETLQTSPVTSYGLAKDTLRRQLELLSRVHPFHLVWPRLFYVYGPGQRENSLLGQLERAATRGDVSFDMSAGEQLRDFLDVSKVAEVLVRLAEARDEIGVVNVCSGVPTSVRRFVEDRIREQGWKLKLNPGAYPYNTWEPMAFWGSRQKLDRYVRV